MVNKERLVENFVKYAGISSGTFYERDLANELTKDLENLGLKVDEDQAGEILFSNANNLYIHLEGNEDLEPLVFSAHMDTVGPCENIRPIVEDGYIKSSEDTILGADDKAGIAAIVEAVRVLKENSLNHRPLELIFTIYEEGGLFGSKNLEYQRLKSKKAIILDSSGDIGRIVLSAPGQNRLKAVITGHPSHAGDNPEGGISALMAGATAISRMRLLRIDNETTANFGSFIAEGTTNVVNAQAQLEAEIRSRDKEKLEKQTNHIIEELEKACMEYGAELDYSLINSYESYKHSPEDDLVRLVEEKCQKLGFPVIKEATGGGSDANSFNSNGIKAITLGTGMEFEHCCQERISVNNLYNLARLTLELMIG